MTDTIPDDSDEQYEWNICPMKNSKGAGFTPPQIWGHCIKNIAKLSIDDKLLVLPGMFSKEVDILPTCIYLHEGNLNTMAVLFGLANTLLPYVRPTIISIAGSGKILPFQISSYSTAGSAYPKHTVLIR